MKVVFVLASIPVIAESAETPNFQWSKVGRHQGLIRKVDHYDGKWLAVGYHGNVLTSEDGFDWNFHDLGMDDALHDIVRHQDYWYAGGESGTLARSADGEAWEFLDSRISAGITAIASSGSMLMAVGEKGTVITSNDGENWKVRYSGTQSDLLDVTHGGGIWNIVGMDQTNLTSGNDGGFWTSVACGVDVHWNRSIHHDGEWYATGWKKNPGRWDVSVGALTGSEDGLVWECSDVLQVEVYNLAVANETIVFVGMDAWASSSLILTYQDDDWQPVTLDGYERVNESYPELRDVHHADGQWVAVGDGRIVRSADAVSWSTSFYPNAPIDLQDVHYADGVWVAGGNCLFASTDGVNWQEVDSRPSGNLRGAASSSSGVTLIYSENSIWKRSGEVAWEFVAGSDTFEINDLAWNEAGQWVAVGSVPQGGTDLGMMIVGDSEGGTPQVIIDPEVPRLLAIAVSGNRWVACGEEGTVADSADGEVWQTRNVGSVETLRDIACVDGVWVCAGDGGVITRTSTLASWSTTMISELPNIFQRVAGQRGMISVFGNGRRYSSTDGGPWLRDSSWDEVVVNDASFENDCWAAVQDGRIYFSRMGSTWAKQSFPGANGLQDIHWTGNSWLVVGNNGLVLESTGPLGLPKLDLERSGDSNTLSWPINSRGFHLEYSATLPFNQSAEQFNSSFYGRIGNRYFYKHTTNRKSGFYRLATPE